MVVTTEDGKTVGHVPIELSEIFNEIPVDFKLTNWKPYCVMRKLSKKRSTKDFNLSRIINS